MEVERDRACNVHCVRLNKYFRCWPTDEWPNDEGENRMLKVSRCFLCLRRGRRSRLSDKIAAHDEIFVFVRKNVASRVSNS